MHHPLAELHRGRSRPWLVQNFRPKHLYLRVFLENRHHALLIIKQKDRTRFSYYRDWSYQLSKRKSAKAHVLLPEFNTRATKAEKTTTAKTHVAKGLAGKHSPGTSLFSNMTPKNSTQDSQEQQNDMRQPSEK
jgi:hypothetical protein